MEPRGTGPAPDTPAAYGREDRGQSTATRPWVGSSGRKRNVETLSVENGIEHGGCEREETAAGVEERCSTRRNSAVGVEEVDS